MNFFLEIAARLEKRADEFEKNPDGTMRHCDDEGWVIASVLREEAKAIRAEVAHQHEVEIMDAEIQD